MWPFKTALNETADNMPCEQTISLSGQDISLTKWFLKHLQAVHFWACDVSHARQYVKMRHKLSPQRDRQKNTVILRSELRESASASPVAAAHTNETPPGWWKGNLTELQLPSRPLVNCNTPSKSPRGPMQCYHFDPVLARKWTVYFPSYFEKIKWMLLLNTGQTSRYHTV